MDASTAKVWAEDLRRVDYDDAVVALSMHYRESADWLMPVHVVRNSRRARDAREREERKSLPMADRQRMEDAAELRRLGELGVL